MSSIRIIAGERKGHPLRAPAGSATRPTLGRVRESLFSMLVGVVEGARVADLYAGAGTLGFEALSRGAAHCVFVEKGRQALDALRENAAKLRYGPDRVSISPLDVARWLSGRGGERGVRSSGHTFRRSDAESGDEVTATADDLAKEVEGRGSQMASTNPELFDLVFLDPPYGLAELPEIIATLVESGRLSFEALVVVQCGAREPMPEVAGSLHLERTRIYGETALHFFSRQHAPEIS